VGCVRGCQHPFPSFAHPPVHPGRMNPSTTTFLRTNNVSVCPLFFYKPSTLATAYHLRTEGTVSANPVNSRVAGHGSVGCSPGQGRCFWGTERSRHLWMDVQQPPRRGGGRVDGGKETYSDFYGSCGGSSGGGKLGNSFLKRAAFLDTPSPRHGMLWVDVQQGGGRVVRGSGLPLLMFVFLSVGLRKKLELRFGLDHIGNFLLSFAPPLVSAAGPAFGCP